MSSWANFVCELDRWEAAGLVARFWWRDDDVVARTPALDSLLQCVNGVPIALAAVPADIQEALAHRLEDEDSVRVFQHGWRHKNYAKDQPASEYPAGRHMELVLQEFRHGFIKLRSIFGDRALPVFVPPWHGFDQAYMPLLREAGLTGFSSKGPRSAAVVQTLECVNIHCVPIEWTSPPSFDEDGKYLNQICLHLEGRRLGALDFDEPTGILTHHLVQNYASYGFMARLSEHIRSHPAARWVAIEDVFPASRSLAGECSVVDGLVPHRFGELPSVPA